MVIGHERAPAAGILMQDIGSDLRNEPVTRLVFGKSALALVLVIALGFCTTNASAKNELSRRDADALSQASLAARLARKYKSQNITAQLHRPCLPHFNPNV